MTLSSSEEARQLSVLTRFRYSHQELLVNSGIARRIIDADVPLNYMKDTSEFGEGTLLYPTRKRLGDIAIGLIWGGKASFSGSCRVLPQDLGGWSQFLLTQPAADALLLGRLDATARGGYSQNTIFAGVQLDRVDPTSEIIALDNIQQADVAELVALLRDVESLRSRQNITCLDPESLVNTIISRQAPTPLP